MIHPHPSAAPLPPNRQGSRRDLPGPGGDNGLVHQPTPLNRWTVVVPLKSSTRGKSRIDEHATLGRTRGRAALVDVLARGPDSLPVAELGLQPTLDVDRIDVADHHQGGALGPVPGAATGRVGSIGKESVTAAP